MRRRELLVLLGVAVLSASCGKRAGEAASGGFQPLDVGAAVPAYMARTLAGDTVHIGGSGAPTVLNVWATWCTSCQEEMAALDSLNREFAGTGVRVVGVSVDEGGVDRVKRYAESNHLAFTVAHDPAGDIQRSYELVGVPTTFVIGRDGKLVYKHTGNIAGEMPAIRAAIAAAGRS